MSMFGNRTAAAPAPATPARSKYGGIVCTDTRDPMPGPGTYRMRVMACEEGFNPGKHRESYKVKLAVIVATDDSETKAGMTVMFLAFHTSAGLAELKRFAIAAAGFGPSLSERASGAATREAYAAAIASFDAADESYGYQGAILEASAGHAGKAPSLVGRIVDCTVARGRDVTHPQGGAPTGDYFRTFVWGSVPDAEQSA